MTSTPPGVLPVPDFAPFKAKTLQKQAPPPPVTIPGMVKLLSRDHEFIITTDAAKVSGYIKSLLEGPGNFKEQKTREIPLNEISTPILEKVIQYFYYKLQHQTAQQPSTVLPSGAASSAAASASSSSSSAAAVPASSGVPPLGEFKIPPEMALELLMAANFLDA
eukprot:TRINITY_DN1709_c0_g1_i1.p1 TRINITY_DN1709_c0_g1~~TRINITY_DN1709_c0_g1_i1.p1  ORF type:complete len:164 (-),score=44.79 TRINITY_DN1709_c0_g1_i1:28-519(-)